MNIKIVTALTIALAAGVLGPARAGTITISGGNIQQGDCTFACVAVYEQVYQSSSFSSATGITGVDFITSYSNAWAAGNNYSIYLGTYSGSVNSLSAAFAANISNPVLFQTKSFSGTQAVGSQFGFAGFYNYDPTAGNLVIEIVNSGQTGGPGVEYNPNSNGVFSRDYNFSPSTTGNVDIGYGDVTVFTTGAAVPEPATLTLLGIAVAALAFIRRRFRIQ